MNKIFYCIANKTTRFDWLISSPSKAVLDRQKAYWTAKKRIGPGNRRPSSINKNKRDNKNFNASFTFFIESFTLNKIWELEKNSLPTAAFKEDKYFSILNLEKALVFGL